MGGEGFADIHDRQSSGEDIDGILRLNLGNRDIGAERLCAPADEFSIAEQIKWRNPVFGTALPGGNRDVGADPRRLTDSQCERFLH